MSRLACLSSNSVPVAESRASWQFSIWRPDIWKESKGVLQICFTAKAA